ncbi:hypothetical protein C8Q75DRAFT_139579 [Abortiporus biennis]|nr:hypothetical protein C8Q75DRAFT_139579 [Abortiporus biennis]
MDLDNYSDYSAASTGPPEKIEVFQNLKLNFLVKGYLEHIFSHKEEYPILGISLKWQILLLQIRSLVVSAFDDYFRIKDWLPQSSFIVDDILFQVFNVHAHEWIDIMGQLAESLDALINRFFQVESYGNIRSFPILAARSRGQSRQYRRELKDFLQTRTLVYRLESTTSNASGEERRRRRRRASDTHSDSDFETYSYYVITELPRDELERSVNALVRDLFEQNNSIPSELDSQWRKESRLRKPRLPIELWDIVINHLQLQDCHSHHFSRVQKALISCCLTCRGFLHQSRKQLYTVVRLGENAKSKCFFETLLRNPDLRRFPCHLELKSSTDISKLCTILFLRGPQLLPNLQSVEIEKMNSILHPSLLTIRRPFPAVTQLRLGGYTFGSVVDFRRLLAGFFPSVSDLDLGEITILSSYTLSPPSLAQTKRLSVSKIILPNDPSYRMPPQIFTCLSWIQNPTALRLLRIGIRCLAPVNLLSSCGRHLHHLIIKLDDSGEIDESISFGADVLPTLQTLVVVIDKMDKSTKSFHALSRSVFSPTLSCIRIWFPEIRRWDEEDCRGLDDTFVQLPRQIRIEIEKRYWKGLPKLKSKGVLVIPTTERGE